MSSVSTVAALVSHINSSNEDFSYNSTTEERIILIFINISVIVLGTIGIVLNGFSIHVLWKCLTTGELGIKLVLLSDLIVCVGYVCTNVQHNIMNNFVDSLNNTHILRLVTINRLMIHIPLFVSNWWIIVLLVLRILTIMTPINVRKLNKSIYHKIAYGFCWIFGMVIIIPLMDHDRYIRLLIYVVPMILVSIEAGLIVYAIRKLHQPLSPSTGGQSTIYQEAPHCSSSTSSAFSKQQRQHNSNVIIQYKTPKPYNHIVVTILALALNFLVLDCLQFIDTLHSISNIVKSPLPVWFMLLINIFSLLKRILNFVILCAKCRHFRKIMKLKLNLLMRPFRRNKHCLRKRRLSKKHEKHDGQRGFHGFNHCAECNKGSQIAAGHLFVKDDDFLYKDQPYQHPVWRYNAPRLAVPPKMTVAAPTTSSHQLLANSPYPVNSYCSAFEVVPNMSLTSYYPHRLVLSAKY